MLSLDYENHLFDQGYPLVGGIDEAGRGPLAGPVVAAIVILDKTFVDDPEAPEALQEVKDSKKISPAKRKRIYKELRNHCPQIGIGISANDTIDRMNILQASFLAMKKAINDLRDKPDMILVDGKFRIPNCSFDQKTIINGDAKIFSIAAASIIAKVTRDDMMEKYHEQYPEYGFDKHKGYGTKQHIDALKQHGPCEIHRKSFKPVSEKLEIKN
jgi:ribonuclease HII